MNVDVVYSEQLRRCEHHRRAVDSACAVNMVVKSIVHEMRDDLACKDEEGQILQSQTLEEKQYVSMYLVFQVADVPAYRAVTTHATRQTCDDDDNDDDIINLL